MSPCVCVQFGDAMRSTPSGLAYGRLGRPSPERLGVDKPSGRGGPLCTNAASAMEPSSKAAVTVPDADPSTLRRLSPRLLNHLAYAYAAPARAAKPTAPNGSAADPEGPTWLLNATLSGSWIEYRSYTSICAFGGAVDGTITAGSESVPAHPFRRARLTSPHFRTLVLRRESGQRLRDRSELDQNWVLGLFLCLRFADNRPRIVLRDRHPRAAPVQRR